MRGLRDANDDRREQQDDGVDDAEDRDGDGRAIRRDGIRWWLRGRNRARGSRQRGRSGVEDEEEEETATEVRKPNSFGTERAYIT